MYIFIVLVLDVVLLLDLMICRFVHLSTSIASLSYTLDLATPLRQNATLVALVAFCAFYRMNATANKSGAKSSAFCRNCRKISLPATDSDRRSAVDIQRKCDFFAS